ncbi:putative vegetative incompatibility protein HET-E-1 [Rosellinia necatrix]|uniref:Putative vegetative incompatibility protein HET-E-1 n=1 Tax=Rosellinia necatrix TaxID=77044 RepID=A0A1S8A6K4_ROSNE|nr:putative vegetative incompatibility protein HET-E-1 [Rosellinia necatrix]
MFQWYHSAAVCYAYLFDVQDDIGLNLARSYWVTRGWTLQELIAPNEVIFFSSEWQVLGTRSALSAQISTITRIQEPFLLGQSLNEASIAQRMSWAAGRDTSREEDEAYCLLGIFDVNMPLIYGEGRKAFRRLQEILTREYPEDHSLFAWGKIASQISGRVSHIEQIWGSKAIKYRPDKATKSFPGLFAESPGDFRDSGDIVLAPDANFFFSYENRAVGVLAFVGKAVEAKMPLSREGRMALHLDGLPIGKPSGSKSAKQ